MSTDGGSVYHPVAEKDLSDRPVHREKLVPPEQTGRRVILVRKESKAHKDRRVIRDRKVRRVIQVLREHKVRKATQDRRGRKDPQDPMAKLVR